LNKGAAQVIAVNGNGLPVNFVSPAGVVSQDLRNSSGVHEKSVGVGLSTIQCFQALREQNDIVVIF